MSGELNEDATSVEVETTETAAPAVEATEDDSNADTAGE